MKYWIIDTLGVLKTDAFGSSLLSMCLVNTVGTVDVFTGSTAFSNYSLLTHVSQVTGDSNSKLQSLLVNLVQKNSSVEIVLSWIAFGLMTPSSQFSNVQSFLFSMGCFA